MRVFLVVLLSFFLFSCEKDEFETEDFVGVWRAEWYRCGNFHNSINSSITFEMTDSTDNIGWITENKVDTTFTVFFHFSFIENEKLLIDSMHNAVDSSSLWLGIHVISELEENSFLLEREGKECEGEQYKFVK